MELAMNNGFSELSLGEMEAVDGGGLLDWACVAGGVYSLGVAACSVVASVAKVGVCVAIASNPIVCGTALVVGAVSLGYGIYTAVN